MRSMLDEIENLPAVRRHLTDFLTSQHPRGPFSQIPSQIKAYIAANFNFAIETVLKATGIEAVKSETTKTGLATQLLLNGAAKNRLRVSLNPTHAKNVSPPECTVRYASKLLCPLVTTRDGPATVLLFELPLTDSFPILQLVDLNIDIANYSDWQLAKVTLVEHFSIATICHEKSAKGCFHDIESDASGRVFAWTAAPVVTLSLAVWRGAAKSVSLEFFSIKENQQNDLTVSVGNETTNIDFSIDSSGSGAMKFSLSPVKENVLPSSELKLNIFPSHHKPIVGRSGSPCAALRLPVI